MPDSIFFRLPEELKRRVERNLRDRHGQLQYGAIAQLCRTLLLDWCEEREKSGEKSKEETN